MTRGRLASAAVLGAVAVVAGAVVVDAVRGRAGPRAPAARPQLAAAAKELADAHVRGTLYFTDDGCRLRALRLPSLVPAPAPRASSCAIVVAPARLTSASWSLWRPGSRLVAFCKAGRVLVRAAGGPTLPFIAGCAPAWAPDGSLDFVRQGTVVQFVAHGRAEVIMPRPRQGAVRTIAWLGRRLAVAVGNRLLIFDGVTRVAERRFDGPVRRLRPSPRGTWLGVRAGSRTVVLDDRLRREHQRLASRAAHAVAWSPDERWAAVAGGDGLQLVPLGGGHPIRLPIIARDLAWR